MWLAVEFVCFSHWSTFAYFIVDIESALLPEVPEVVEEESDTDSVELLSESDVDEEAPVLFQVGS